MISPDRDENGYRNYSQRDIETLKLIALLRSMEVSIEEIKSILNHKKTIRSILETKKDVIKKQKIELDNIDEKIHRYLKREEIKVYINQEESIVHHFDRLCLNEDCMEYQGQRIEFDEIEKISISMSSSIDFMRGLFVFFGYHVDIDIYTKNDYLSFQIENNNKETLKMFDYLINHHIVLEDPLNLVPLYHDKQDALMLNKYLDLHFKKWAKEYHLDNPRKSFLSRYNDYKKYWDEFEK